MTVGKEYCINTFNKFQFGLLFGKKSIGFGLSRSHPATFNVVWPNKQINDESI